MATYHRSSHRSRVHGGVTGPKCSNRYTGCSGTCEFWTIVVATRSQQSFMLEVPVRGARDRRSPDRHTLLRLFGCSGTICAGTKVDHNPRSPKQDRVPSPLLDIRSRRGTYGALKHMTSLYKGAPASHSCTPPILYYNVLAGCVWARSRNRWYQLPVQKVPPAQARSETSQKAHGSTFGPSWSYHWLRGRFFAAWQ